MTAIPARLRNRDAPNHQPGGFNAKRRQGDPLPHPAMTSAWTFRFGGNNCQWLNPQDSCGKFYRKMSGDLSCWEATGPARETFIQIADEIKAYLEKHSDPIPHPVTWTIYMIGQTKGTSKPMIMFCGRNTKCRKQVRKTLQESGILKNYPGVRVGDASRPPDFDQLVQLTGVPLEHVGFDMPHSVVSPEYKQGFESSLHDAQVFAEKDGHLFGKRIAVIIHEQRNLDSVRMATAGGILKFGERYFYLTAGHAFEAPADKPPPYVVEDDDNDFEFDIGEGSDFEDEVEFSETTSRGSVTPELSGSAGSDSTTISISAPHDPAHDFGGNLPQGNLRKDLEDDAKAFASDVNAMKELLQANTVLVGCLLSPLNTQLRPSIDYALIEIDHDFRDFNRQPLNYQDSPYLQPRETVRSPHNADVLCVTGSTGCVKGSISGTPTHRTIPDSSRIQELWTVTLGAGGLKDGDCGSWVVDAKNGKLLGHVIEGCPKSGVAYIVPAYHVLEDAKKTFGLDLELYTPTELASKMETPGVEASPSAAAGVNNFEITPAVQHQTIEMTDRMVNNISEVNNSPPIMMTSNKISLGTIENTTNETRRSSNEADGKRTHGTGGRHGLSWSSLQSIESTAVLNETDDSKLDRESGRGAGDPSEDRSHKTSSSGKLSASVKSYLDVPMRPAYSQSGDSAISLYEIEDFQSHEIPTSGSTERIARGPQSQASSWLYSAGTFLAYFIKQPASALLKPFTAQQYPVMAYTNDINDVRPDATYEIVASDNVHTLMYMWESQNPNIETKTIFMVPGASVDQQIFALPTIEVNAVDYFTRAGYRVYVTVHRICHLAVARNNWTTYDARLDIRACLEMIREREGKEKIYTICHCMGAVAYSSGLLDGTIPSEWIKGISCSQVFCNPIWATLNLIKACAGPIPFDKLYTMFGGEWFSCSSSPDDTFFQRLINQALRFYPDKREEICNNVSCHRCSLVFGR